MEKEKYFGIYRGIVEDIEDPIKLGRCKIRVPAVHGPLSPSAIPLLPWARYVGGLTTGYNKGQFVTPEVGDVVWVFFEGGEKIYPCYIGSTYGITEEGYEPPIDNGDPHEVETLFRSKLNDEGKYATIKKTNDYFEFSYDKTYIKIYPKDGHMDIYAKGDINMISEKTIHIQADTIHLNKDGFVHTDA